MSEPRETMVSLEDCFQKALQKAQVKAQTKDNGELLGVKNSWHLYAKKCGKNYFLCKALEDLSEFDRTGDSEFVLDAINRLGFLYELTR